MPTLVSRVPPTPYNPLPGKDRFNVPVAQSRRTWPWVVAVVAILFVVIAAVVIMAVVIPPMLNAANNNNRPRATPTPPASTPTPSASNSPWLDADDAPDDEDEVKSQLTKIEEEWTEANVKGDKKALERILADEYKGGPSAHTKREYINNLEPDPSIKSWELGDLTVEQDGNRATVQGTLKNETEKGTDTYKFTDKFVWRDRRWQAVASKTTSVK